jgi:hypothetical protein
VIEQTGNEPLGQIPVDQLELDFPRAIMKAPVDATTAPEMISHMALFDGEPVKNFEKLEPREPVAMKPKTRRTTPSISTTRPAGFLMVFSFA